ncbi:MAG: CRISPR-associated helicase Cas3' [Clostridia bacterium]
MGTAKLASDFASVFGCKDLGYLCGLVHDIGKYSQEFQKRIRGHSIYVDHSTAGAIEIYKYVKAFGIILAYCIAGHHAGLPDGGSAADTGDEPTLYGKLKRRNLPNYGTYRKFLDIPKEKLPSKIPIQPVAGGGLSISFLIRMLYSCLVDADYLDTERFMSGNTIDRSIDCSIDTLLDKLLEYIKRFDSPVGLVNEKRCEILNRCLHAAENPKGIYTLTVPTGGGKTISSLSFALKHAKKHGMKRIIYVIPYTSIIEQNAAVIKSILGSEYVLEHHSNIAYDDESEEMSKLRLATENWDIPIVVTTNVQFFESFFSNRASKCRKLHNTANSVILFDEAQMLPIYYLLPCIRTISELVTNYGSTCVLCSATQPAIKDLFPKGTKITEIIENAPALYKAFKRTNIKYIGKLSYELLIDHLEKRNQVLCIVNTRKTARNISDGLSEPGNFHLSTLMCPVHRSQKIAEIKDRLKKEMPCRVISTSLIEAGVDVDFPAVYRQMAGLESQIQAAGRCNREGRRSIEDSNVYIYDMDDDYNQKLPSALRRPTEIAKGIAERYTDVSSPEAIEAYFTQLFHTAGKSLDYKDIISRLEEGAVNGGSFPFHQIASEYKLIEDITYGIIIPYDEKAKLFIERLKNNERTISSVRNIQPYIVNVYKKEAEKLLGVGAIEMIDTELFVLMDTSLYNERTGLKVEIEDGIGIFC